MSDARQRWAIACAHSLKERAARQAARCKPHPTGRDGKRGARPGQTVLSMKPPEARPLSEETVKNHVSSILRCFGVTTRTQAVLVARRHGYAGAGRAQPLTPGDLGAS